MTVRLIDEDSVTYHVILTWTNQQTRILFYFVFVFFLKNHQIKLKEFFSLFSNRVIFISQFGNHYMRVSIQNSKVNI